MHNSLKNELIFSLMMTFGMVTIMLTYNTILAHGFTGAAVSVILAQFIPVVIVVHD